MFKRTAAALLAASLFDMQCVPSPARADNPMGYQLLSARQAADLPRRGGALGMEIGPAQRITDAGLSFELLRVNGVRRDSPGAQAGFNTGDQIIAANGRVFPSVAAFAAYIGSVQPGRQIIIDYIPAGGGPQQAQRAAVTVGARGHAVPAQPDGQTRSTGMSTGTKLAIGAGAAALFGCYELGCVSRSKPSPGDNTPQQLPGRDNASQR